MNVCKLLLSDIKNGIFKNLRFLVVPILALLQCLYNDSLLSKIMEYNSVDVKPTFCDLTVLIFRGCEPLLKFAKLDDAPDVPIFWVGIFVFGIFFGFDYLHNDLTQFGMQMVIRTNSRTKWWLCKCAWCIISSLWFYVLFTVTILLFCIFAGYDLSFKNNIEILEIFSQGVAVYTPKMITDISKTQSIIMLLSPLFVISALNMLQMLFTIYLKPMYSYMVNVSVLSVGFLSDNMLAFSRCAMSIYSDIFLDEGFDIKCGLAFCVFLIFVSIIIGLVCFKRCDILPDKEDN